MQDYASLTAMILFSENIGSTSTMGAGQATLSNLLISKLAVFAPYVNPLTVIATGATEIENSFPAQDVPGIIHSFLDSIRVVFWIVTAYAGISAIVALGSKWGRSERSK